MSRRVTHSPDDGCVPPHAAPGEVYVTASDEPGDVWPALVDLGDRWNGWLSPLFRPAVARALAARHVAWLDRLDREGPWGSSEQDQLVLSPDGRTLAHLIWDEDALGPFPHPYHPELYPEVDTTGWPEHWLTTREHSVWAVYDLANDAGRVAVGAWHWCWHLADGGG